MKRYLVVLFVLSLVISSCGGGSGSGAGSSSLTDFFNGSDASSPTSYWSCDDSSGNSYYFGIFEDGTGYSTSVGTFAWTETGDGEISITYSGGTSAITNISAAIVPKASFTQDGTLNADCTLIESKPVLPSSSESTDSDSDY